MAKKNFFFYSETIRDFLKFFSGFGFSEIIKSAVEVNQDWKLRRKNGDGSRNADIQLMYFFAFHIFV